MPQRAKSSSDLGSGLKTAVNLRRELESGFLKCPLNISNFMPPASSSQYLRRNRRATTEWLQSLSAAGAGAKIACVFRAASNLRAKSEGAGAQYAAGAPVMSAYL